MRRGIRHQLLIFLAAVGCGGNSASSHETVDGGREHTQDASSAPAAVGGSGGTQAPAAAPSGTGGSGGTQAPAAAPSGSSDSSRDQRSPKRGVAYDFCKGYAAQGQPDLVALRAGDAPGNGITWFYNWGASAGSCLTPSDEPAVEYVPMVWGLSNGGSGCAGTGACFNDGLTVKRLVDELPQGTRYLLGFNEPNFAHQSNLTPTAAASAWSYLEQVAKQRKLQLVAPATNYCDPNPNSDHAGSCTKEAAEHTFKLDSYELTVPAGHRYNAFEWAELFYDECSAKGSAAHDCQIDYQAGHVYSYWGLGWYIENWKRKAGLLDAAEAHCKNGMKDADEFAKDCGGNACAACSDWARKQFAKALWLSELAPSTDDGPSPRPSHEQLVQHAADYIASELPKLEGDSYVFRYAWFTPRTNAASLDHVDLLTDTKPATLTAAGMAFTTQAR